MLHSTRKKKHFRVSLNPNFYVGWDRGVKTSHFPYPVLSYLLYSSTFVSWLPPFLLLLPLQVNKKASKPMPVSAIHCFVLSFFKICFWYFAHTGNNGGDRLKVSFAWVYLLAICPFCTKRMEDTWIFFSRCWIKGHFWEREDSLIFFVFLLRGEGFFSGSVNVITRVSGYPRSIRWL